MEGKNLNKLQHLDLAKRRSDLEGIFDSIINKIPDLLMPPSYRLAGENDFFNQTKDLKIVPFRHQMNFDTCFSPDPVSGSSPTNSNTNNDKSISKLSCIKPPSPLPRAQHSRVSFGGLEETKELVSTPTIRPLIIKGSTQKEQQAEVKIKYETREKLIRKYSRMKIKKTTKLEDDNDREGYDRLLRTSFAADYPFANPIADCMLTDDNIDNLRKLIVSSINIEWKMLTPIKPASECEEKYFDKLIYLHRSRYKCRLKNGYFCKRSQVPFRHTRHSFLLDCTSKRARHSSGSANEKSERETTRPTNLTIPELTLTSDDPSSELPVKLDGDSVAVSAKDGFGEDDNDGDYISGADDEELSDDHQDFDFANFSRFSRRNLEPSSRDKVTRELINCLDDDPSANREELAYIRDEEEDVENEELEDQMEMIISQLVNTDL